MIQNFIPLASPDINEDDIAQVVKVLRSGMLVQGENVLALENQFAGFHNTNYASALSNGTATLHLALLALGVGAGDEVILPALSYIATANVIEIVGATCVFVDVDVHTFTIDTSKIEDAITSKTKAIIPVHEFGLAANMEDIMAIATKHNIAVVEDSACALGATQNNKPVGTFGSFGSFSLHPRKSITSGEGGILITNDETLAKKINILRNHGISMENGKMNFVEAGFNYRMTDFQAALANNQMKRIVKTLAYKQELADVYFEELNNPNIQLPFVPLDRNHTWQTYHILINDDMQQDEVIASLRAKNLGVNYGAQCIPSQTYYQKKYKLDSKTNFPNADRAFNKGIALPLYEKLDKQTIKQIAKIVNTL